MTEETRNVIMRNGKIYVGGDVTKEYVDTAIADAVADIDDDISALSDTVADKVDKENGKSLSTNDYTDADKALVQDSPITVSATGSDLTLSTSAGNINAITVYGKSEVVDGSIKSAGEGYAVVDLGTLTWDYYAPTNVFTAILSDLLHNPTSHNEQLLCAKYQRATGHSSSAPNKTMYTREEGGQSSIGIKDTDYTSAADFKTAMSGVLLCFQLADPTQDNCIAIKTDDGTGINGTMATFTTGTPLRGIPDTSVRDVMAWDGSVRTVTKNCGEVDLGTLTWAYYSSSATPIFYAELSQISAKANSANMLCPLYVPESGFWNEPNNDMKIATSTSDLFISNSQYTDPATFKTAMTGVNLVYELATPTTQALTASENASIAGLETYSPQTHAQNNAGATMTVEAYAGTANGKAVNELKQDVQSEISALKITQSATLTLTTAGWSSNQQTVTYAHDTAKRNVIDVEPASIKAWTAAGILATSETATSITFECDTVPTSNLSFRVTSMEVR